MRSFIILAFIAALALYTVSADHNEFHARYQEIYNTCRITFNEANPCQKQEQDNSSADNSAQDENNNSGDQQSQEGGNQDCDNAWQDARNCEAQQSLECSYDDANSVLDCINSCKYNLESVQSQVDTLADCSRQELDKLQVSSASILSIAVLGLIAFAL